MFGRYDRQVARATVAATDAWYGRRRRGLQRVDRGLRRLRSTPAVRAKRAGIASTLRLMAAANRSYVLAEKALAVAKSAPPARTPPHPSPSAPVPATPAQAIARTFGTFKPFTATGHGNKTLRLPPDVRAGVISFTSDSKWASAVAANVGRLRYIVSPAWKAAVGVDGVPVTSLDVDVEDDANWTVTIIPIGDLPWADSHNGISGHGRGMFLYDGKATRQTFQHDDKQHDFNSSAHLGNGDSVVLYHESKVSGTNRGTFPQRPCLVTVDADRDDGWLLSLM